MIGCRLKGFREDKIVHMGVKSLNFYFQLMI